MFSGIRLSAGGVMQSGTRGWRERYVGLSEVVIGAGCGPSNVMIALVLIIITYKCSNIFHALNIEKEINLCTF